MFKLTCVNSIVTALICIIVSWIGCNMPPSPVPPLPPAPDPQGAIVKISLKGLGCSASILDTPGRPKDSYLVLCASHCSKNGQLTEAKIRLKNGRIYPVTLIHHEPDADLAIFRLFTLDPLPTAQVVLDSPPVGTKVWHMAYGVDKPGNLESGTITAEENNEGQIKMSLSASSGDSGGGIFVFAENKICSVVCCGQGKTLYGASARQINNALREAERKERLGLLEWEWQPLPLPVKGEAQ